MKGLWNNTSILSWLGTNTALNMLVEWAPMWVWYSLGKSVYPSLFPCIEDDTYVFSNPHRRYIWYSIRLITWCLTRSVPPIFLYHQLLSFQNALSLFHNVKSKMGLCTPIPMAGNVWLLFSKCPITSGTIYPPLVHSLYGWTPSTSWKTN